MSSSPSDVVVLNAPLPQVVERKAPVALRATPPRRWTLWRSTTKEEASPAQETKEVQLATTQHAKGGAITNEAQKVDNEAKARADFLDGMHGKLSKVQMPRETNDSPPIITVGCVTSTWMLPIHRDPCCLCCCCLFPCYTGLCPEHGDHVPYCPPSALCPICWPLHGWLGGCPGCAVNTEVSSEGSLGQCATGCACCPLCYVLAALLSWWAPEKYRVGPCCFCLGYYCSLGKSEDEDMHCCGDIRNIEDNPPGYWVVEGPLSSEI